MTYNHNNFYTKFLNNASKTLEFITNIVSANQSHIHVHARAFMLIIWKATSKCIYISSLKEKYSKLWKLCQF